MDITQIVIAVIGLASLAITTFLIPYIKSKTSHSQQQTLAVLVQTAVQAAEQIYKGTGLGEQKKEWVIQFLQEKGIHIDTAAVWAEVDALIEAAVYAINSSK